MKDLDEENEDKTHELCGLTEESTKFQQFVVLLEQSFPMAISFFLAIGGTFINLSFAGHYSFPSQTTTTTIQDGKEEDEEVLTKAMIFAGLSLANMFSSVCGRAILMGMSGGIETLASQENGAGNYEKVGIILQRSLLILSVIGIPIGLSWLYIPQVFLLFGIHPLVCKLIYEFLWIRLFALPMDIFIYSYEKYLNAIGVMTPCTWGNLIFIMSIFLSNEIMFNFLHWDYLALGWSYVIAWYFNGISLVWISLSYLEVQRTLKWTSLDPKAWEEWKEFIALSLPTTIMICSEWWAYEFLTIFASLLGTVEVAAQTVIIQTSYFVFMIPLGVSIASASLIGNTLGASKINLSKSLCDISLLTILGIEIGVALSLYFFGNYFIAVFTDDQEVLTEAMKTIPFLSIFTIVDGLQGVCGGILRGCGKQYLGAITNVIAFYPVGLPIAWYFCFNLSYGVRGLIIGMSFGSVFQASTLLFMIYYYRDYLFTSVIHNDNNNTAMMMRKKENYIEITDQIHDDHQQPQEDIETSSLLHHH